MESKLICKECGAPLAADAPEGLCPKCLLKVAMGTQAGSQPPNAPTAAARAAGALPDPARLAEYFPQLEILELLGQGGMGAVYKARQPGLDRLVALKILPPQAGTDTGFAERFNREARALAKLSHPNIVAVYDFGQTHGLHYFIMEYVDGPNLRQIERAGKLTTRQALQIIPQICEALQFAHDEGVVHRDVKPENVLLDKKGRVKIADFGLAKILGREPKDLRLPGVRDVMGTPHYMAPEQVEHPQEVDHRADIYSLGVVFYEMLTGELPLGRFAPPSHKVQVDVRLDEVVLHTLEKEPSRRYQHASQVKTDVETIAKSGVGPPPPPPPAPGSGAWKVVAVIAAALMLILAIPVGAILLTLVVRRTSELRQATTARLVVSRIVVSGIVTDAATGKPIAGARVADNFYDARPNRAPQAAWTKANGCYELKTWPEEHTLAASAPGYETKLATLITSPLGTEYATRMDFQLQPAGPAVAGSNGTRIPPVPPVVIQTVPESGSSDVDPALTELRVTFSKPMKDQCWAWCYEREEDFPTKNGEPRFLEDGRSCVQAVKLQPGKVYAIWLNTEKIKNFQDLEGQPAVPYLLIFETRK